MGNMSIKTRALVFATFFGNCLVIGLLIVSLTTNYWIEAIAKRHSNGTAPSGVINFGLFAGHKDLNVGYGNRPENINGKFVISYIKHYFRT